ncbi:MAG: hypothetical protein Q4F96_03870, partial [Bacillota bacterium]|nr:hypothetical protein [Bacillota bacterium]
MKLKKLLALMVAAFTLIAATSVSFATTTEPAKGTPGTESNPAQAAVGKLLQVPEGTTLDSNQSFTFSFAQQTDVTLNDASGHTIPITSTAVNIDPKSLTIKKNSTYQETANGTTTYGAQTGNIFDGVTFPNAGVYAYKVTEDKPADATANENGSGTLISTITQDGTKYKVTKQYSGAEYMMYVYVKNKEDGSGTYVAAVGIEMTKGDGIPGTEGTEGT